MGTFAIFMLAIGLSMDAFAVAVSIGLTMPHTGIKKNLIVGLYFGGFQAVMPLIGYLIASRFASHIVAYSHWIAFVLLLFLGGKMISSGLKKELDTVESSLSPRHMLPLALATSIDALAVGVSLAFLYVDILPAVVLIGVVTFIISGVGVYIGGAVGVKFKSKAAFIGGAMLIMIGVKILLEHI
ncbi:MAG: manganese efflux pump MntP family protein [Defluviitaleaceae bacterium]|nr:manganese efflux pump MntP family protein [Defluviitaleaceae bacterium]